MKFTTFNKNGEKIEFGEFHQINETLFEKLVETMFVLYEAEVDNYIFTTGEEVWNACHMVLFKSPAHHYVAELHNGEITISELD